MVYDCHDDDDGGGLGVVVDDNDGDDDVDDNGDDGGDGDEEYSAYYFLDLSDQAGRRGTSGFSEFVSSWFCYTLTATMRILMLLNIREFPKIGDLNVVPEIVGSLL